MFRRPAAAHSPAARSPAGARRPPPGCVRPAQQADGRDSQRARPEPDPDDPAHLSAKWTDSNQAAAARLGERKQAIRRLSVASPREHPSRQPDPWYACQQKNTGGGQRVSG